MNKEREEEKIRGEMVLTLAFLVLQSLEYGCI